jgi:hypothetical protein
LPKPFRQRPYENDEAKQEANIPRPMRAAEVGTGREQVEGKEGQELGGRERQCRGEPRTGRAEKSKMNEAMNPSIMSRACATFG